MEMCFSLMVSHFFDEIGLYNHLNVTFPTSNLLHHVHSSLILPLHPPLLLPLCTTHTHIRTTKRGNVHLLSPNNLQHRDLLILLLHILIYGNTLVNSIQFNFKGVFNSILLIHFFCLSLTRCT